MSRTASQVTNEIESGIVTMIDQLLPALARVFRQSIACPDDADRLTLPQLRTMQAIGRTDLPGSLNAQLARQLHVAAPSMTAMIDGLVERGLVDRSIDPNNRRQVLIQLTPAGSSRLQEMESAIDRRIREMIMPLSQLERARMLDGLQLLAQVVIEMESADPETTG